MINKSIFVIALILSQRGRLIVTDQYHMIQTKYFRTSEKEYCHITDDAIFIFNTKEPTRIPLEHELGEGWAIASILNYILFTFLFVYVAGSASYYGISFFKKPINYAAVFLLFISFIRVKEGFISSKTPTIARDKIKSVYLKTPKFSYPRLVIYFTGPEGKVLRRKISVLYKQEAIPVLKETGLLNL